ncbi:MAG: alpha/beta hydrolase [Anaerolineae bacterium]
MSWLTTAIAVLTLVLLAVSWRSSDLVIYPRTRSVANSYAYQVEQNLLDPDAFASLPKEEIRILSPFGYELFALYVPSPGSRKTVILAHGIRGTSYHSVKYLWAFRKRGFNALLIEHRNHGRSGGTNTTFGFYEKEDMRAWVDYLQGVYGSEMLIGTHGESMGAAIALQHAIGDPRIAFVVADCAFASARDEIAHRLGEDYGLPPFPLIPLSSLITKLRTGFAYEDAAPIKGIENLTIPVLFIHGAEDTYIPPEHSIRLYKSKPEPKRIWLAPDAGHAESLSTHPDTYDRLIGDFLSDHDFI